MQNYILHNYNKYDISVKNKIREWLVCCRGFLAANSFCKVKLFFVFECCSSHKIQIQSPSFMKHDPA